MSTASQTLKLYSAAWWKHPLMFAGSLLIGPGFVLQVTIAPLFIAKSVNQLVTHHPVSTKYLVSAAVALVVGSLLRFIGDRFFLTPMTVVATQELYRKNLQHLLRQDYSFFADNFGGSLVAQANRFAKGYELFVTITFLELLGPLCSIVLALGIMMAFNLLIGTTITVLWLASVAIIIMLAIRRMPIRRDAVAAESKQTGELADIIANSITIKTFARESTEESRYARTNQVRANGYLRSWTRAVRNGYVVNSLATLLALVVFIGGILAVQFSALSVATFLLFQLYVLYLINSLDLILTIARQVEGLLGDAHEMTELLKRRPTIEDAANPEPSRIQAGAIHLDHVLFSYTGDGDERHSLLREFDLQIAPGEKVGLVGPSGGGKSTLTKLLLRFVDVQGGAVLIDGQDIRQIRQDDLHKSISYVPQEPLLFHRTIRENIAYGYSDISHKEIVAVAKQAHADEFITELPDGYDTLVGERGIKLSGGQRQRIAIARAMLKKAPILVLDEATSALDSESERYIQQGLWKLMEGKTTLVIAHRLSTIQRMDRIVVLDHGKIIEQGTHQELLKHDGLYAKLWAHQSGGFIEELGD